jgi:hypothetical protein
MTPSYVLSFGPRLNINLRYGLPTPWDIYNNKLARLIDHSHIQASSFTELFEPDGPELLFERYATHLNHEQVNSLRESSPNQLQFDEEIRSYDGEFKKENRTYSVSTWRTIDPKKLVDDDRYEEEKDKNENKPISDNSSAAIGSWMLRFYIELVLGVALAIITYKLLVFLRFPMPPLPL